MRSAVRRSIFLFLCCAGGAIFGGCDARSQADYSKITLVEVSGAVTLEGEPLPNAVVTFESPDGQFSYGITDETGAYELRLDSRMDGVTPGEKTVRISTARKLLGVNASTEGESPESEQASGGVERVPLRYNRASELRVVVPESGKEVFDFDLKS